MNNTPTEEMEQRTLIEYLELRQLVFTAIPNNTYTPHMSQKVKNHRMGLRAGFPDLIVLIPPKGKEGYSGVFLCIELKRTKGGRVSDDQVRWISAINGLNIENVVAVVCKGAQEAIDTIEKYIGKQSSTPVF